MRFSELGLLGERPELIVSGINHGSNLGDDITYSGTVAAALEGIVLGIPAIAISQQSVAREMDFRLGREFDFSAAAALCAEIVRAARRRPAARRHAAQHQLPRRGPDRGSRSRRSASASTTTSSSSSRRTDGGRRRYRIYGFEPSFEDEEGTDLAAVARGRVAITPVHFDLTDRSGLDELRAWDFEALLESSRARRASAPR